MSASPLLADACIVGFFFDSSRLTLIREEWLRFKWEIDNVNR